MAILYKARALLPSLAPARSKDLFAPIRTIDNCGLLVCRGKIVAVGRKLRLPPACKIRDLGDVTILPPFVNCHTHLQLSWLAGKTLWRQGFVAWLKSMIPQLLGAPFGADQKRALAQAFASLAASGAAWVGDIGGSITGSLTEIELLAKRYGIGARHFCEWIGFGEAGSSPWPERCRSEVAANPAILATPAAHSLYSTSAAILQKAHAWCKASGHKFTFHLAESPEETCLLTEGKGDLADFYRNCLFPASWRPPRLAPMAYAEKLRLLGPETIAVHGVTLTPRELASLAQSGAALCICARSNNNLGVGSPPVKQAIEAGLLLCLGTDGLTSCDDLDLGNEIKYICANMDIPLPALLRMAIANGARALGLPAGVAGLFPGSPVRFSVWHHSGPRAIGYLSN